MAVSLILLAVVIAVAGPGRSASAETVVPVKPVVPSPEASTQGFLDGFLDSYTVGFLDGAGTNGAAEEQRAAIESAALKTKVRLSEISPVGSNTYGVRTGKLNKPQSERFVAALKDLPSVSYAVVQE